MIEYLWLTVTPSAAAALFRDSSRVGRQLRKFPTKMKVPEFLLNTAWLSMMKWVWILGAVAHRSTIVPLSCLNIWRSDCNSEASRWKCQKWDVVLFNLTVLLGKLHGGGWFSFSMGYLWCIYRNQNLVRQWGQFGMHMSREHPLEASRTGEVVATHLEKLLPEMQMWKCLPVNKAIKLFRA